MHKFRNNTPKRRENRSTCSNYQSYKKTLSEDFEFRCWYCDDNERVRNRSYAIDHFVPRNPIEPFVNHVNETDYYNLVYACSFCNLAKWNTWPTCDWRIHNDWLVGFIDPTNQDYSELFKRDNKWVIVCNNKNPVLSDYIRNKLKLWLPIHSIHWKIDKLINTQRRIKKILESKNDPVLQELHNWILQKLWELSLEIYNQNE